MTATHKTVACGDIEPNRRRGAEIRVLLGPATVGATTGFLGVAVLAPGECIAEHYHPYSEEFLYVVSGTLTVDLDGEPTVVHARRGRARPDQRRHRLRNTGTEQARVDTETAEQAAAFAREADLNGRRRTAVTGIGVVAPGGSTRDAFWSLITEGRTATRLIRLFDASPFPSRVAAECDFDPGRRWSVRTGHSTLGPVRPVRTGGRRGGAGRQRPRAARFARRPHRCADGFGRRRYDRAGE
jgi:putative monooxygenase